MALDPPTPAPDEDESETPETIPKLLRGLTPEQRKDILQKLAKAREEELKRQNELREQKKVDARKTEETEKLARRAGRKRKKKAKDWLDDL